MKKLIAAAVAALTLIGAVFAEHPMTYIIDMADMESGKIHSVIKNPYAENWQSNGNPEFTSFVKGDLPKAGDKIELHYKFTSNIDLHGVSISPVDTSTRANYWMSLTAEPAEDLIVVENLKAGEVCEGVYTYTLDKDVLGKLTFPIMYNDPKILKKGYEKVSGNAKLTFEKTGAVTTKMAAAKPRKPKTYKVDVSQSVKLMTFEAQYQQDGTPTWYQNISHVTDQFKADDMPKKGDTIIFTYKGVSDADIPELRLAPVENSGDVKDWWLYLNSKASDYHIPFAKDIKAGKTFTGKCIVVIDEDVSSDVTVQITYLPFEGSKKAMLKFVK